MAVKISTELTVHTEIEEAIIYPAIRAECLGDLVAESEREHRTITELAASLESMDEAMQEIDPVLAELNADMEHPLQEEESDAFPKFPDSSDQASWNRSATRSGRRSMRCRKDGDTRDMV